MAETEKRYCYVARTRYWHRIERHELLKETASCVTLKGRYGGSSRMNKVSDGIRVFFDEAAAQAYMRETAEQEHRHHKDQAAIWRERAAKPCEIEDCSKPWEPVETPPCST